MTDQYIHRREPQNEDGRVPRRDQEEGIIPVSGLGRSRPQMARSGRE